MGEVDEDLKKTKKKGKGDDEDRGIGNERINQGGTDEADERKLRIMTEINERRVEEDIKRRNEKK